MKRYKNEGVITRWTEGTKDLSYNGALRTDGVKLWSYDLLIAVRARPGATTQTGLQLAVADFTAPSGNFKTVTTSTHVNAAKRCADIVVDPESFDQFVIDFTV